MRIQSSLLWKSSSRKTVLILSVIFLSSCSLSPQLGSDHSSSEEIHLYKGSGPDEVGISDPQGSEEPREGPEALASDWENNLYLLDQINKRVLKIDPKGDVKTVIDIPSAVDARDMVIVGNQLYLWDQNTQNTIAFNKAVSGAVLSAAPSLEARALAHSAFAAQGTTDDNQTISYPGLTSVQSESLPNDSLLGSNGQIIKSMVVRDDKSGRVFVRIQEPDGGVRKLYIPGKPGLGSVAVIRQDSKDNLYLLMDMPQDNVEQQARSFVLKYAGGDSPESVYEIPLNDFVDVPRRYVTVTPEGKVFYIRTTEKGIDIENAQPAPFNGKALPLPPTEKRNPPSVGNTLSAGELSSASAEKPMSRSKMVAAGEAYFHIDFPLTTASYDFPVKKLCKGFGGRIMLPMYLIEKKDAIIPNCPYSWGGFDSSNIVKAKLAAGNYAGNVCTREDPRPKTSGVDCSGFVSRNWGLSRHYGTGELPNISVPVNSWRDLKPGDIFLKPGSHVRMFVKFDERNMAYVYEAAVGNCGGSVCANRYSLANLNGYQARRYKFVQND